MKSYNMNKRIVIAVLSAAAVLLAGGLWVYLDSMGNNAQLAPILDSIEQSQGDIDIDIPEIQIPESNPQDVSAAADSQPETQAADDTTATTGGQSKPSDGKPKTPDEAVPPEIPAVAVKEDHTISGAENPNTPPSSAPAPAQPENSAPKSGDKNSQGEIYVPGFGWIPNSGEKNTQGTAPNAGTGEIIGSM